MRRSSATSVEGGRERPVLDCPHLALEGARAASPRRVDDAASGKSTCETRPSPRRKLRVSKFRVRGIGSLEKLDKPSSDRRPGSFDQSGEESVAPQGKRCPHCGATVRRNAVTCDACRTSLIGRGKKTAFAAIVLVFVLGTVELVLRAYFATLLGPSVFWFGTSVQRLQIGGSVESSPLLLSLYQRRLRGSDDEYHNVRQHTFVAGNYTKYFPNESRFTYDADTGEVYRATINARGFRGPEIVEAKPSGTIRVVTLGASSTFGYHDPDDGTYPATLERVLNQRCSAGTRYEVVNLGIPHLTSSEIASLFVAEGLPLTPDVVTFYEGINDSSEGVEGDQSAATKQRSVTSEIKHWAREHFLISFLYHEMVTDPAESFDAAHVEKVAAGRPEHFVENLARVRDECRKRGILLVVGKQQARSLLVPREKIKGVTYADEIARVREKLSREGHVSRMEMNFLIHERVLAAEER